MRIHTSLKPTDLRECLKPVDHVTFACMVPHGSRKRDVAYEVSLEGYGDRHRRRAAHVLNTGKAATYEDWGWFLARLFELDPDAIAGPYKGADDFHNKTHGGFDLKVVA